ncbi:hypothetical protein P5705_14115 [Pseudomonas entomophila]|uniref:hypothetical protein n=1 Tax=Pseudomonas entomophila TaxID=312306 RepID=UPI0024070153|nr:hypothetical protein [Pseudomonas entomophila]MDF9618783.1 hypothetical protein [Pseudomonas entomophila]
MLDNEIIHCLAEITGLTTPSLPAVLHYREASGPELEIHIEADHQLITLWCKLACPVGVPVAETLLRVNCAWRDPSASWLYYDADRGTPILVSALPRADTYPERFRAQAPLFFSACSTLQDVLARAAHH